MNIFLKKTEDRSKPNRRDFLIRSTCASLGITSVVNTLAQLKLVGSAAAQGGAGGYKALICFFHHGGNDANNLLVPAGGSSLARTHYQNGRGILTLPDTAFDFSPTGSQAYFGHSGQVTSRITPQNGGVYDHPGLTNYTQNNMALHPLAFPMARMFEDGDLAFVANVGTLVGTTSVTRANFNTLPAAAKPPQLFSHSDQQVQWQSSLPDQPFTRGWGGKIADLLAPTHGPGDLSLSVSLAGVNSFQVAGNEPAYFMSSAGTVSPLSGFGANYVDALRSTALQPEYNNPSSLSGGKYNPLAALTAGADPLLNTNYRHNSAGWRLRAIEQIMAMQHAALFDTEYLDSGTNARVTEGLVGSALGITAGATAGTSTLDAHFDNWFPTNLFNPRVPDIANQLKVVARMIAGRSALSNTRQIFFVQLGGHDTHTSQTLGNSTQGHQGLVNQAARAVRAFKDAMLNLPGGSMWDNVLMFAASDFNRTFTPNKSDATGGSDHGWGGHSWVAGGSVKGRNIYGFYPNMTVNGGIDVSGNRGRWIPTTSTDQFYAPIAKWFGCTDSQISQILPNFTRFQSDLSPGTLANKNLDFINFAV
jgi:uncharacterized protein (DUF1501 family)